VKLSRDIFDPRVHKNKHHGEQSNKGDGKMTEDMVQCPKDTKIMYQRDVCENIFRKSNIRCWCKTCELFKDEELETENL
jgi:acetyl-CoA carboxylase beta subunit